MDNHDSEGGSVFTRFFWLAFAALLVVVVTACGAGNATQRELDEANGEENARSSSQEKLPDEIFGAGRVNEEIPNSSLQDELPGDLLGAGWVKVDEWPVEFEAGSATGCPEFDAIVVGAGHRWYEALWMKGETRLSHRIADIGSEAGPMIETAGAVPTACPTVEFGGTEVKANPLTFDTADGFELSAFPLPDTGTAGLVPKVDTGSRAWVIVLHHGRAVSVLTVEDDGSLDATYVERLVATARKALASVAPEPGATTIGLQRHTGVQGAATTAVLTFDSEECRNGGTVEAFGVVWELAEPVPFAWRGMSPKEGTLTIVDDLDAAFTVADGTELRVTIGPIQDECFGWDDDEG